VPVPQEVEASEEEERPLAGQYHGEVSGTDGPVHLHGIMADRDPVTVIFCEPVDIIDDCRAGEQPDIAHIHEQAPDVSLFQSWECDPEEGVRVDSLEFGGEAFPPEEFLHVPRVAMGVKCPEVRFGAFIRVQLSSRNNVRACYLITGDDPDTGDHIDFSLKIPGFLSGSRGTLIVYFQVRPGI
jgi:hypothetical protein